MYPESSDDEDALEGFESEPFSDSDEDMAAADEEKANSSAHEESEQIMEEWKCPYFEHLLVAVPAPS